MQTECQDATIAKIKKWYYWPTYYKKRLVAIGSYLIEMHGRACIHIASYHDAMPA